MQLARAFSRITAKNVAWALFCVVLAVVVAKSFHRHESWVDVTSFVCGAQAVREHQSPYLVQPLYSCEVQRFAEIHHPEMSTVVTPSPLPFYAFVPFIPISLLSQKMTLIVWYALLIASVGISCILLKRLTNYSIPLVFLALFIPCVYFSFILGQIVPFVVCAILGAIWYQKNDKIVGASLCAIATMIEPHLGLPVCIALFLIESRSRIPLICGAVVLAAISLSLGSLADNLQYFREILPMHAATEVSNDEQLSLTHIAWLFGATDRMALLLGSISYAISLIAGCIVAVLLSRIPRLRDLSLIVAPSFGLIGGTYSHVPQFSVFIVFALLLSARASGDNPNRFSLSPQFAACVAVVLLDLPLIVSNLRIDTYMYMGLTVLLAHFLLRLKPIGTIALTAVTGVATLAISVFRRKHDLTVAIAATIHQHLDSVTAHAHYADEVWLANMSEVPYQIFGKLVLAIDAPIYLAMALTLYALYQVYKAEKQSIVTA